MQVLRRRNCHRIVLPAHSRSDIPRSQIGQRAPRSRWTHQDRWLWHVQDRHESQWHHQDILWHAGLHCSWGKTTYSSRMWDNTGRGVNLESDFKESFFSDYPLPALRQECGLVGLRGPSLWDAGRPASFWRWGRRRVVRSHHRPQRLIPKVDVKRSQRDMQGFPCQESKEPSG